MSEERAGWETAARMSGLYGGMRVVVRMLMRVWFRWRVHHPERVPSLGPVILAANHASFADPPLVGCAVERSVYFLARNTLFDVPGFGALIRALNAVPVDRDGAGAAGLRAIFERLKAGGAILLFPEGTRTRTGALQPAHSGIGLIVIKSNAPVVPIRIFGSYETWGRHQRLPRPGQVVLKFGEVLDFSKLRAEARTCDKARLREIYDEVSQEIMARIGALEPCEECVEFPRFQKGSRV